jgi:methionyl-tRNA synthetase
VSRTSFSWGIPVPGDEKHVIYVWLDALANYITALGYGSDDPADKARFEKFWPADLHLVGKEITRFHCVYWPAFLMAAGLPLPRSVMANGWLLFDQGKMSKSRGNVVRAETVVEVLGADALRYFLLREIPFGQDGGFSFDALVQRYNGDLANGYGNLVSRVVNMVHKYFGGVAPKADVDTAAEASLRVCAEKTIAEFGPAFEELNFSEALKSLWVLVAETDGYLTANAPWKKPADRSEADHSALQARVLATAAEAIRIITALVYPIMPDAAAKVWRQLGQGEIADAAKKSFLTQIAWGGLKAGTKFGESAPLFPRAEKDAIDRMQNIEDQNCSSTGDAAAKTEDATLTPKQAPAVPQAPAKSGKATSAPAAKTAKKGAIVSEKSEKQTSLDSAPVDSVGVDAANEAHAYETVALASSSVAPQAPTIDTTPAGEQHLPPMQAVVEPQSVPLQVAAEPQKISIDDVLKVDLRVAQILVAERVPKADKLLRLEVDLGYEKRQILAGIAQYYEPEKLVGRKIVIVANLAPRMMRGLESNGMLLAASLPDGAPVLAGFLEEVPLGARLK